MILSGHQPVYLPGIILFDKIAKSDAFMFVGHCQFCRKSWHTRNKIAGDLWLNVPVHHTGGYRAIDETKIINNNWRRKHLKSIEFTYQNRPFFNDYFPYLKELIEFDWQNLSDMNSAIITMMIGWFGVDTRIYHSQEFDIEGHKTDMLINMCKAVGADTYLSNEGARAYVMEDVMAEHGITHKWQDFIHPIYDQGREFEPNLSAIDLLFNLGPNAKALFK